MPPTPADRDPAMSVAALNERIRSLFTHPDKRLSDEERRQYTEAVAEWTAAAAEERCEVVEAA